MSAARARVFARPDQFVLAAVGVVTVIFARAVNRRMGGARLERGKQPA